MYSKNRISGRSGLPAIDRPMPIAIRPDARVKTVKRARPILSPNGITGKLYAVEPIAVGVK